MLVCEDLCKSYAGHEVLRGISIEISRGSIVALIGPSGAGKSTFVRLASALEPVDSGRVLIDGRDCTWARGKSGPNWAPWPKVTTVFQQLFLWPHLTLLDNVLLPLGDRSEDALDNVQCILQELAIEDLMERHPNEVSQGQRQRVAIARALALEPQVLLLDEITSALDVEQVYSVGRQLDRLRGKGGVVLVVTHLLDFARRIADRVLFFDDGRIAADGTPAILDRPACSRMERFLSFEGV